MKSVLSFALAAALVGAAAARADVPAGFVSKPTLAAKAQVIAGKPITVLCANDTASWNAEEATRSNGSGDVLGHAQVGGDTIYLSPTVCPLLLWAKPKTASYLLQQQGAAIEVLAHEAEHIAGHTSEGETECAALAALPAFARTQFGITTKSRLRWIMDGAWRRHRTAEQFSPTYIGACG